jgi:hypothetical protein
VRKIEALILRVFLGVAFGDLRSIGYGKERYIHSCYTEAIGAFLTEFDKVGHFC